MGDFYCQNAKNNETDSNPFIDHIFRACENFKTFQNYLLNTFLQSKVP